MSDKTQDFVVLAMDGLDAHLGEGLWITTPAEMKVSPGDIITVQLPRVVAVKRSCRTREGFN